MKILEHGQTQEKTLLFLPCTAEPVWAFAATVKLLSQKWHVFQVVYDGHQPEYPGDFTSVEQTVDEITAYLKDRGVSRLDAAYGCSLGGACLTRMLALGEMPVGRAIIDGGITPYQQPFPVRKLLLLRDVASFNIVAAHRDVLEAAFPPERFTIPGHDTYWYGDDEKKDRRSNIRFIKRYFPQARIHGIPKMAHAELVIVHPEEFCRYAEKFLAEGRQTV